MTPLPSVQYGAYTKLKVSYPSLNPNEYPSRGEAGNGQGDLSLLANPFTVNQRTFDYSEFPLPLLDMLCFEHGMQSSGHMHALLADYFTKIPAGKALAQQLGLQRTPTQDNIGFMGFKDGFFLTDAEYDVWAKQLNEVLKSKNSIRKQQVLKAAITGLDRLRERYKPKGLLKVSLKWENPTSSTKKLVLDKVSFDTNA